MDYPKESTYQNNIKEAINEINIKNLYDLTQSLIIYYLYKKHGNIIFTSLLNISILLYTNK